MSRNKWVFLILILAIAIRIFAVFLMEDLKHPQVWEYEEIANNILQGKGLYFTFFNVAYHSTAMVLYPLVCAGIYFVTGHSFLALKLFQVLLSAAGCFLIYLLSKKIFGQASAIIALILMAFHPGLIIYTVKLHSLSLDILLFALFIYFYLSLLEGQNILRNGFFAGVFAGLAVLTRAVVGLFMPFAFLIMALKMKVSSRKIMVSAAVIATGLLITLSPLMIRNCLMFHKPVIFPNDSGFIFWIGNNSHSTGTENTLDGKSMVDVRPKEFVENMMLMDEFQQKEFFYKEASNFIKTNPVGFVKLFFKKMYYFWWFTPTQGLNYPGSWFIIYRLYYCIILPFVILGFLSGARHASENVRRSVYVIALFCVVVSIAQAIYYVEGRHRWLIEPFLLIFASGGIMSAVRRCMGHK